MTRITPNQGIVDKGYQGHSYEGSATVHVVRNIPKRATRAVRRMLKHHAAVEPTIGHLKSDNRLCRNYLKGKADDQINVLLAAAGYNLRWIGFSPFWGLWNRNPVTIRFAIGQRHKWEICTFASY